MPEPPQHGLKLPVTVVQNNQSGEKVLLCEFTEDDLWWPDESRELYACDVFDFIGIGKGKQALFDLFYSESAQNAEPQFAQLGDQVHFGKVYTLVERACARCSLCRARCTSLDAHHSLCSHGSFTHLWCRPQRHCGNNKTNHGSPCLVEGYANGCGLKSRFSNDEINTEISRIEQQYGITPPHSFRVSSRGANSCG